MPISGEEDRKPVERVKKIERQAKRDVLVTSSLNFSKNIHQNF